MTNQNEPEKLHMTLASTYVPEWGSYEGLREIAQNWLDELGDIPKKRPSLDGDRLTLVNPDAEIRREHLLIGSTTKAGIEHKRGEFGEGLKLGALALAREGLNTVVRVRDEKWESYIEPHPTLGVEVLTWEITKGHDPVEGTEVSVYPLSSTEYDHLIGCFRWGSDPTKNHILTKKDDRGLVYVKGIHVMESENLYFGYDLYNVRTDRDRRLISEYALKGELFRAIKDAVVEEELTPKKALAALLSSGLEGDANQFDSYPLSLISNELTQAWIEKYEDAIPCSTRQEVEAMALAGRKGKLVSNDTVRDLIAVEDADGALAAIRDGYTEPDLTGPEKDRVNTVNERLAKGKVSMEVKIVNHLGYDPLDVTSSRKNYRTTVRVERKRATSVEGLEAFAIMVMGNNSNHIGEAYPYILSVLKRNEIRLIDE